MAPVIEEETDRILSNHPSEQPLLSASFRTGELEPGLLLSLVQNAVGLD